MDTADTAARPKDDPTIWRVDDELWERSEPVLVLDEPRKKPGSPTRDERPILDGLIWPTGTSAYRG